MWELAAMVFFGLTCVVTDSFTPRCNLVKYAIGFSTIIVCKICFGMPSSLAWVTASLLINIVSFFLLLLGAILGVSNSPYEPQQSNNFEIKGHSPQNTESPKQFGQVPNVNGKSSVPRSPNKTNITPSMRSPPTNLELNLMSWCQDNSPQLEDQLRSPETCKMSPSKDVSFISECMGHLNPSCPEEWREWCDNKEQIHFTFKLSKSQISDIMSEKSEQELEKKNETTKYNCKDEKKQRREEKLEEKDTSFERCKYVGGEEKYVEDMIFSMTLDDEEEDLDTEDEKEKLFSGYPCDDSSSSDSDSDTDETTLFCCYCYNKRHSTTHSICNHCRDLDECF